MEILSMPSVLWIKKYRPKDIESPKDISENYYLVQRTMKDTGWKFYIYRPKAVSENAIHKLLLKNIPIILISVLLLSFLGYVFPSVWYRSWSY